MKMMTKTTSWSGRVSGRYELCGRRSENVGPRRGFDYVHDYCGGSKGKNSLDKAVNRRNSKNQADFRAYMYIG